MSTSDPHADGPGGPGGRPPTEEELRAAYEAELKRIHVHEILLDQIVSLINLGMRRTGLAPGTEDERDPEQVRLAVEAIRALLPVIEPLSGPDLAPIRDALSQLQMAYVRIGGQQGPGATGQGTAQAESPGAAADPGAQPPKPGQPGAAQSSGRLWIPGQ